MLQKENIALHKTPLSQNCEMCDPAPPCGDVWSVQSDSKKTRTIEHNKTIQHHLGAEERLQLCSLARSKEAKVSTRGACLYGNESMKAFLPSSNECNDTFKLSQKRAIIFWCEQILVTTEAKQQLLLCVCMEPRTFSLKRCL